MYKKFFRYKKYENYNVLYDVSEYVNRHQYDHKFIFYKTLLLMPLKSEIILNASCFSVNFNNDPEFE